MALFGAQDLRVCGVYFSTDALCTLNIDALFNAGHTCAEDLVHDDKAHRCKCGATKERKR